MLLKQKKSILMLMLLLFIFASCQKKEKMADKRSEEQEVLEQHLKEYKRILEVNPKDLEILISLGNLYYDMGKWDNAIDTYLKALAIDSTNIDVRTDMGTAYKRMEMYDLAIREYKKGIAINPKHAKVHYNLGVIYYEHGNYKDCLTEWEIYYKLETDQMLKESVKSNIEKVKQLLQEGKSLGSINSITPLTAK